MKINVQGKKIEINSCYNNVAIEVPTGIYTVVFRNVTMVEEIQKTKYGEKPAIKIIYEIFDESGTSLGSIQDKLYLDDYRTSRFSRLLNSLYGMTYEELDVDPNAIITDEWIGIKATAHIEKRISRAGYNYYVVDNLENITDEYDSECTDENPVKF